MLIVTGPILSEGLPYHTLIVTGPILSEGLHSMGTIYSTRSYVLIPRVPIFQNFHYFCNLTSLCVRKEWVWGLGYEGMYTYTCFGDAIFLTHPYNKAVCTACTIDVHYITGMFTVNISLDAQVATAVVRQQSICYPTICYWAAEIWQLLWYSKIT